MKAAEVLERICRELAPDGPGNRLVPLVEPTFPRYSQMLRDAGRADLLEAA